MTVRLPITSAAALVFAGPAFADCMQEIQSLSETVTQAETGASSAATGLPATQHQESVLAGDHQQGETEAAGASDAGQGEMPASPHQQQALTQQKIPYEVGIARYREIARGQLIADPHGLLKLLFHPQSRRLLGVHAIGTGATELIHIGQTVMAAGLPI